MCNGVFVGRNALIQKPTPDPVQRIYGISEFEIKQLIQFMGKRKLIKQLYEDYQKNRLKNPSLALNCLDKIRFILEH